MSTSETTAEHNGELPVIHLSQLLRSPVLARSGEAVGIGYAVGRNSLLERPPQRLRPVATRRPGHGR